MFDSVKKKKSANPHQVGEVVKTQKKNMNKLENFLILKEEACHPSNGEAYLVCILQTDDDSESIHLIPLRYFLRKLPSVPDQIRISQFATQFAASGGWPVNPSDAFLTWFGSFEKEPLVLVHETTKLTVVYVSSWDDSFVNNKA